MRYEDWDVILFPVGRDSKIPFKEFKVGCHVVPDLELSHIHGSAGMPAMTCFVPSLPAGTPFQISIHCWRDPEISSFARAYSKHPDLVKFEARILLDGHMVASTAFDRTINGPHLITSTFEFTKTGELERLRFPQFRRELQYQNHWNPGDDVGRIKIVISEGFPRDSLSVPIERVKNVVAFSFQHAPLEILESNGIAWPSPSMWRRPSFNASMPVPTYQPEDGPNSHAHSPRRKSNPTRGNKPTGPLSAPFMAGGMFQPQPPNSFIGSQPVPLPYLPRSNATATSSQSFPDLFMEPAAYFEWFNSLQGAPSFGEPGKTMWPMSTRNSSKQSSTDTSMPDYVSNHCTDPMHISGPSLEDDPMSLKVPTNTPTTGPNEDLQSTPFPLSSSYGIHSNLATSLTHSLLNQPLPLPIQPHAIPLPSSDIKSRKENRHLTIADSNPSSSHSTPHANQTETRKFSQPVFGLVSNLGSDLALSGSSSTSPYGRSPGTQPIFHNNIRNASAGDFGSNLTNLNTGAGNSCSPMPHTHHALIESGAAGTNADSLSGGISNGNTGTTATKRSRNFTPVSAKVIDEEDEPRRASPHVRISGYGGEAANEA